jgi:type II pantothenate kinase
MAGPDRLLALIRGIFAGNIFDLGCSGTTDLYESDGIDFHKTRADLPERPWRVDDFDLLAERLAGPAHGHAVLFVDNAGADVTLGMIPLARFLLQRGTTVTLTANDGPALNDITHEELRELIGRVEAFAPTIREARRNGQLRLIGSGNGLPVIDLSRVARPLAEAARDADLLVIEGMGRALETNYHARFTCDTLKLAMVKEQNVAELVGGELYDLVCRFEPAPNTGP